MRLAVIGPGALGTFLAGILACDNELVLLGRRDLDMRHVVVQGQTDIREKVIYTTDSRVLKDVEMLILCTKSYDTKKTMEDIHRCINHEAYLLSLQNGLMNEAIMAEYVGEDRVIGGVTSHGFTRVGDGKVIHTGIGDTIIGNYPNGDNTISGEIADLFTRAGLSVDTTDNIYGYIWKKVIINAGINPITALTGLKNGQILESPGLRWLMKMVCDESIEIARTQVELPGVEPVKAAEEVARATAENVSSMLQDIKNTRRTEIDCINGAIIGIGEEVGLETPFNRCLYSLVKAKESSYL